MSLNIEGHMGLKSSPLATTSCKLTKQFLVLQHLNAHNKKITNVKSSIDTTCPKSWYKHMNVKDQIKRERSARNSARIRPTSAKSQTLSPFSLESSILDGKQDNVYQFLNTDCNLKQKQNELTLEIEREDLIDKNFNKFTESKSFTPRILKNDKAPKLTQLRCYNAPKRKSKEKLTENTTMKENESMEMRDVMSEKIYSQQESSPKQKLSDEEIRLKELDFLKDLTDDILLKHNFTDREVEQTCEYHTKRNKFGLTQEQMRKLCFFVMDNTRGVPKYADVVNQYYTEPLVEDYEYDQSQIECEVTKQDIPLASSTAPAHFGIDDLDSIHQSYAEENILNLSKSNSSEFHHDLEIIRESFDNIKVEENNQLHDSNKEISSQSSKSLFDPDETIKNVHFASQNETFSAQETDRSLTRISSIQAENSDDSTSVNLSIEMNPSFKNSFEDAYLDKMHDYDEDFDD